MSSQSSTPPTPKGPRNNNRRNSKRNMTPSTQKVAILATPPSSPPRNMSPGGTTTDSSVNVNGSKKKPGRSSKKPREVSKASPAPKGHRHTSSQPSNIATPQAKDSSHYAGPTFHASPAPSALPIPSFFSKSLPESDLAPALDPESDNLDVEPDLEYTPSKPKSRPQAQEEERQSTPLDFLFKAAVEARNLQNQRSPESNIGIQSPQTDFKTLQHRNKPNGTAGELFRMEMEDPDSYNSRIGPSFATPYKERMNALRSASSPSPPMIELDEQQKRAKTEALKTLLLNPRPQRPSSSIVISEQANRATERPAADSNVPHFATPLRTTSGPPAPLSYGMSRDQKQSFTGNGFHLSSPPHIHSTAFQQYQPQNSPLRQEILSPKVENLPGVPAEAYYPPTAIYEQPKSPPKYAQYPLYYPPVQHQSPASRSVSTSTNAQAYDAKKMEDDLRRILKLDVNPGLPTSGIQSSFA
ncbi:hypothetical protein BO70DRAFT_139602 [Aspergillus heteromorphus CBS 117.55]|uniref:Uncharacterized protein n=1 Tax=Aspergillus heteromorphus CBS 117.55 TaxID=1448321 RepID=A0A317V740_9EURO|nr:uncharacterized protein BO70DRAFT_139602 [Aspergillus heteromorphus CBS 117.55]PWY70163.1 hypothetical protein BO70DRAFT_139602 [Aspergillus heteromorphus CBS 117.55]